MKRERPRSCGRRRPVRAGTRRADGERRRAGTPGMRPAPGDMHGPAIDPVTHLSWRSFILFPGTSPRDFVVFPVLALGRYLSWFPSQSSARPWPVRPGLARMSVVLRTIKIFRFFVIKIENSMICHRSPHHDPSGRRARFTAASLRPANRGFLARSEPAGVPSRTCAVSPALTHPATGSPGAEDVPRSGRPPGPSGARRRGTRSHRWAVLPQLVSNGGWFFRYHLPILYHDHRDSLLR